LGPNQSDPTRTPATHLTSHHRWGWRIHQYWCGHPRHQINGTPGGIRTPNLLIRSYLLELKLMRFHQFNRVSRCQEESGEVTNVGDVTDISTDISWCWLIIRFVFGMASLARNGASAARRITSLIMLSTVTAPAELVSVRISHLCPYPVLTLDTTVIEAAKIVRFSTWIGTIEKVTTLTPRAILVTETAGVSVVRIWAFDYAV